MISFLSTGGVVWVARTRDSSSQRTPIIAANVPFDAELERGLAIPETIDIRRIDTGAKQRCRDLQRRHADVVLEGDCNEHGMLACREPVRKERLVGCW